MEDLEALIASVFGDVPRPSNDELLHSECRDPASIVPFEPFQAWQEIPTEVLCRNYDGMSFFSPAAFRFFLPAFLQATLRLFETSTDFVSDATIYELNPQSDYARSRFSLFTPEECQVVASFLEVMVANPEHADSETAKAALSGFWSEAAHGAA